MNIKNCRWSWEGLLIASIVLVAGVCSQAQQAAWAAQQEPNEAIIAEDSSKLADAEATEKRTFWIGIQGDRVTSPVLRTHLQLASDLGVVVQHVMPGSPAEKAGLQKHDVLLRVNGDSILSMATLQDLVRQGKAAPLKIKLIRIGKEKTITVIPEESPRQFDQSAHRRRSRTRPEVMQRLLQRLGEGDLQNELLALAPGMLLQNGPALNGSALNLADLPGGIAVTVTRENDGPPKITVQQGEKTWEVVGDDPKSLDQLPEQLRPFVEKMLQPPAAGWMQGMPLDFEKELNHLLKNRLGGFAPNGVRDAESARILERMEQLEKRLQDLQSQLREEDTAH